MIKNLIKHFVPVKIKPFEELTFTDDFIFGKVMRQENICRQFLELILKIKIGKIKFLGEQKKLKKFYKGKAIFMDIYLKDEDKIINIEMQNVNKFDLPERSRFYQAIADVETTKSGTPYKDLCDNYVIFICNFDPFGKNFPIYEFEYRCKRNPSLALKDRTEKIFINLTNTDETLDEEQIAFYHYVKSGSQETSFTHELDNQITLLKKTQIEKGAYMFNQLRTIELQREAYDQGVAEGVLATSIDNAEKMLKRGLLTNEDISDYTNLPLEDVIELAKKFRKEK